MIEKDCPYCGGHRLIVFDRYPNYYVACEDCGSRGPMKRSSEGAMSAFNTRVASEVESVP